ncbi:hypothetical protein V8F33_007249 [Rhypophila sp. PSN 637]
MPGQADTETDYTQGFGRSTSFHTQASIINSSEHDNEHELDSLEDSNKIEFGSSPCPQLEGPYENAARIANVILNESSSGAPEPAQSGSATLHKHVESDDDLGRQLEFLQVSAIERCYPRSSGIGVPGMHNSLNPSNKVNTDYLESSTRVVGRCRAQCPLWVCDVCINRIFSFPLSASLHGRTEPTRPILAPITFPWEANEYDDDDDFDKMHIIKDEKSVAKRSDNDDKDKKILP